VTVSKYLQHPSLISTLVRLTSFILIAVRLFGTHVARPGKLFTARCTLVQSAVLRSHVVCLSVRPSVC